jgi:hypothetical protein
LYFLHSIHSSIVRLYFANLIKVRMWNLTVLPSWNPGAKDALAMWQHKHHTPLKHPFQTWRANKLCPQIQDSCMLSATHNAKVPCPFNDQIADNSHPCACTPLFSHQHHLSTSVKRFTEHHRKCSFCAARASLFLTKSSADCSGHVEALHGTPVRCCADNAICTLSQL